MEEKKLSILGLRSSGKSTFMAVLNVALSNPEKPSKWVITALDDETNSRVYAIENTIFNEGFYPSSTREEGIMYFSATKNAQLGGLIPSGNFKIIAGDMPGEGTLGTASQFDVWHDFYKKHVAGSSAIIFLLDPREAWIEGETESKVKKFNYFPLFRNILTQLKQQAPDAALAFGTTKIDYLPKEALQVLPEKIFKIFVHTLRSRMKRRPNFWLNLC